MTEPLPPEALPPSAEPAEGVSRPLDEIGGSGTGPDVRFTGIVVGLLPPSGVVQRCPACRRTLSSGHCREHGEVEGTVDLRSRLVVDDGTGTATVELGREATEEILGRRLPEIVTAPRSDDGRSIEDHLVDRTFGRFCSITGRASSDAFGLTVFPDEVRWATPPLKHLLESAHAELERIVP